ncbi:5'-3' exonuclease [Sulfolobus sp. A20]|uniref:DNA double-strand break repair nuclease NurA n=1 Tax=Sulfolobaceae TaxID=118883 RepID=UPI000845D856|nr:MULTISPECIES: DNA double-strand break repair nuclease NurA [unclassified Sulfolobus]TRM77019.1 5'-3' exonuclease [Sulfolobus sp. B5]TRM77530.1 5'-3' exonuclease [Sulfolobus sp. A20-N-F8]TRM83442.1 5'-3' exonuclease [Sulfolobus sp. A20-N-F6]TRM84403.1 5'-3' exonuclease [Sulfolobus sp. F3]TRM86519.1 5'-3' exonuclease [Sulfolobus sp. C3]TRM86599.1 5'-3' exonuclease [Sulfolobus sp. E3]TRM99599.1 5'-3' exonuclease [Sulfolobus sp. F1]TRN04131.1 5'-3' exonuclease [Sulfolobus sp. E1]
MITKVYDILLKDHQKIRDQIFNISKYLEKEIKEQISANWRVYNPNPKVNKKIIAIDGGSFTRAMRIGILYVIDAEAVLGYEGKIQVISEDGKIGFFRPGVDARERANLLMEALELKLSLDYSGQGDYVLLDGNLVKKLGKKVNMEGLTQDDLKMVESLDIDNIISLKDEKKMKKILELLNQYIIAKIVEDFSDKVMWISKISRSKDVFNTDYPDTVLLELFTQDPGFSKILTKTIDSNLISDNYDKLEILKGMEYSSFYVRLSKGSRVLRVDVLGRIDENIVKEIVDVLANVSIKGYPFPLLKAHIDVRISSEDRRRILNMIGSKFKKEIEWWPSQFY